MYRPNFLKRNLPKYDNLGERGVCRQPLENKKNINQQSYFFAGLINNLSITDTITVKKIDVKIKTDLTAGNIIKIIILNIGKRYLKNISEDCRTFFIFR